jgi:hypothetical protein
MMQERSYETFRALQQKNAFPSYLSPSTRCGMPDLHTYHYFSYQSPCRAPLNRITLCILRTTGGKLGA